MTQTTQTRNETPPKRITIWSTDFHITPIDDLKKLMKHFEHVRVIDKSFSGHCHLKGTCAKDVKVLTRENAYHTGDDPSILARRVTEAYKDDPEFATVDVVVCFHPITTCELYFGLNKTIWMISTTRYEHGQEAPHQWRRFNEVIRRVAANPKNVVGANSKYDVEYLKYFTGVDAEYIPSFCAMDETYAPTKREILLAHSHVPGNVGNAWRWAQMKIAQSIQMLNSTLVFRGIDEMYPRHYEYAQLASHPAIVHFPYQTSVMSFFEHYRMAIPIFVPSLEFLVELHLQHGVVSERTWARVRTGKPPMRSPIEKHPSYRVALDPNDDVSRDALKYWFRFADYYTMPHVILFHSFDDLITKLNTMDLNAVSKKMMRRNQHDLDKSIKQWASILARL